MKTIQEITDQIAAKVGLPAGGTLRTAERVVTETVNEDGTTYVSLMEVPWVESKGADWFEWIEVTPEDWAILGDAEQARR